MERPDRWDLAVVLGSALGVGAAARLLDLGVAEWLFYATLLVSGGLLTRALGRAWRLQRAERERARLLDAVDPGAVAAAAVRRERAALYDDIRRSLCQYLEQVVRLASDAAGAGPGTAREIHRRSQEASAELRRQLGLLREDAPSEPGRRPDAGPPAATRFGDLLIGAAAGLLGLTEAYAYRIGEDLDRSLLAVALTAAAAFCLTWRGRAAAPACLAVAGLYWLGAALGEGLVSGFWVVVSVGGLTWAAVAPRGAGPRAAAAATLLVGSAGAATQLTDPDNAALTWVVVATVLAVAALTRGAREIAGRAADRADTREDALAAARQQARAAERRAMARDLHDVVSHAVGLIALQSAAAEVAWTADPASSRRAFRTIEEAARGALAELQRFDPDTAVHRRTPADLHALVHRISAAGTPVVASGLESVPPQHLDITYRLLQEALTNALRHARGARVVVTASADPGTYRLRVRDDGPGLGAEARRGYGLVGLRERVVVAGGELRLVSPPGGGLVLEAELPCRTGAEATA